jgi:hypothetical protein
MRRKSARHPRNSFYTNGELNSIIDSFMHPLTKRDPRFLLVDGLLHGFVERNPGESVLKFIRYDSFKLMEQIILRQKTYNRKLERQNGRYEAPA